MSDKFKAYGTLGLGVLAFFLLVMYSVMVIEGIKEVPIYKFIMNGFFGLLFIKEGLTKIKKL